MIAKKSKIDRVISLSGTFVLSLMVAPWLCTTAPGALAQQTPPPVTSAPTGNHSSRGAGERITDFFRGLVQIREKQDGGMEIKAPFVNVNRDRNGVNVKAPFTDVGSNERHVRVKAPFTSVGEDDGRVGVHAPLTDVDSENGRARVRAPFARVGEPPLVSPEGSGQTVKPPENGGVVEATPKQHTSPVEVPGSDKTPD